MLDYAAIIIAWTALITAILKFSLDAYNAKYSVKKQETLDEQAVISEYKKMVEGFNKQVSELWAQLNELQKQNTLCQVESEKLKGDIRVLQGEIQDLRTNASAMDLKAWADLRKTIEELIVKRLP